MELVETPLLAGKSRLNSYEKDEATGGQDIDIDTKYIEYRLTGCIALGGKAAWNLKLAGPKGVYRVLHNYEGC